MATGEQKVSKVATGEPGAELMVNGRLTRWALVVLLLLEISLPPHPAA